MSEHQYYEFLTVGRKLSAKEQDELDAMSSHADVTSTRFRVTYDWGDFRRDPRKLVAKYFDAHVYAANWGTRSLIFRLPAEGLDVALLRRYFVKDAGRVDRAGEHLLVEVAVDDEGADYFDDPSLSKLVPLRAELLRGDLRFAYLAWLAAVQYGEVADSAKEPPVPAGLRSLTSAQDAFADLFGLDMDLLDAAAEASSAARGATSSKRAVPPARTVAELLALAEAAEAKREEAEAASRARRAKKKAAARNKELDELAKEGAAAWKRLAMEIDERRYAPAVALACDLRDLAARDGATDAFVATMKDLKRGYTRTRPTFVSKWLQANR